MSHPPPAKVWAAQIRAPFLLLSVVLTLIGAAVAASDGVLDLATAGWCLMGVVLAHIAVNLFNELSDHRTGIDEHTERTPFSGGSGTLQAGWLRPAQVKTVAWVTLLVAGAIGVYLTLRSGWPLALLILSGGAATLFYTSHLSRWTLGEISAGITLGSFVVLGTYYAQAHTLNTSVLLISVPPGILTALLLFLNEFPDAEADRIGGRRHLVIVLGYRRAALLYTVSLAATYLFLAGGVWIGVFPGPVLLTLLSLPLAFKAAFTVLRYQPSGPAALTPALGANVGLVLGTDLLLAVAFFVHSGLT